MKLKDEMPKKAQINLTELLVETRKIFIVGEIEPNMAKDVVLQLHALSSINNDPIHIFINSPGGHVDSGYMIYDAIRFIKSKVIMIGSGNVASAGALIYVSVPKERRYSLPNTKFLLHQPSGGIQGPASNVEIYWKEIIKTKKSLDNIFSEATGKTVDKIREDTDRDLWLSAEEAVHYGLVSKVVTSETELDL